MRTRLAALVLGALTVAVLAGGALAEPFEPRPEPQLGPPSPAPAAAPVKVEPAPKAPAPAPDPFMAGGLRLFLGSLGVVVLVLIASRVVRRLPMGRLLAGADGPIRVAASAHLGPKVRLCLLEVAGTSILVAVHAQGVQPLHTWSQGVVAPPAPRPGGMPEPRGPETPVLAGQLEGLAARLRGSR